MLDRQPTDGISTPVPVPAPRHRGVRRYWRVVVRVAGCAAAVLAIARWPSAYPPYGPWFWGWLAGLLLYAASFAPAARRHPFPPPMVVLWLLGILGLAVALRLPRIADVPANISIDELLPAMEAWHIASGRPVNVFASIGWFSMPNLSFAFPALVMKAIGPPFYAQRLSSMLMGVGGIAATFLLARRLFGDAAALIGSFLMAVAFWHIHNSRTGFPFVQSTFCPALVMYLLVRARQQQSRACLAVAGIALGWALQCYFPVRILLVTAPLFLMMDWWAQRTAPRAVCAEAAIVATGALLAIGPLLRSVPLEALAGHSLGVLLVRPGALDHASEVYHVQGLWPVFQRNLAESAGMFTSWADVCVLNRSPGGLLDDGTLAALLLGILVALLQGGAYVWFLLIWAAVTFVFGVAFSDAPRASYRLAAAMPALFILAAVGVERVLVATAPSSRWYGRTVRVAVLLALAWWVGWQNHRRFFLQYTSGDGHETAVATELRFMGAHCDGRAFYFFAGESLGPETQLFCPNLHMLSRGQVPNAIDVTRPATFFVTEWQGQWLDTLRTCYPGAQVTPHVARDGRPLFTRVDVPVPQLVARRAGCAG
jgi:4-amino-4-deoxy-L-arabinose transferase-like glycosyltransferase